MKNYGKITTIFMALFICLLGFSTKALAAMNDAKSINIGTSFSVEHRTSSEDWYKFSVKAGQNFTIAVTPTLNSGDIYAEVYDANGKYVNDSGSIDSGETKLVEGNCNKTGTFYLKISGSGIGKYKIDPMYDWTAIGANDIKRTVFTEPYLAKYIKQGNYKLSNYGIDCYRFTAVYGKTVTINFTPTLNSGYMNISLYDKDDHWIQDKSYIHNSETGTLNFNPALSGVYYVKVTGNEGTYNLNYTGIDSDVDSDKDGLTDCQEYYYKTNINGTDTDGDGISDYDELKNGSDPIVNKKYEFTTLDKSNSKNTAMTIPAFDKKLKVVYESNTENWYKFDLNKDSTAQILLESKLSSGDLYMYLYDSSGNYLDDSRSSIEFTANLKGTYYLKVAGDGLGSYKLSFNNAWYNSGVTDISRSYSSTKNTAKYINKGNYVLSEYSEDWYRFNATDSKEVNISLSPVINSDHMNIDLYDSNGNYMNDKSYIHNGENGTITFTPALTGMYYIKISGNPGRYILSYSGVVEQGDKIAPTISSITPANNSTNVTVSTKTVTIKFSEKIQQGSNFNNISIKDSLGKKVSYTASIKDNILTLSLNNGLSYGANYFVSIPKGVVKDMANNALSLDFSSKFSTESIVAFKDKNLENEVRSALGKKTGYISPVDMQKLVTLDLDKLGIKDLSGLEYASNLKYINLANNSITSVSQLSALKKLQVVLLANNKISNLKPLLDNNNSGGIGVGCVLYISNNPLDTNSKSYISTLRNKGVIIFDK